MILLGIIIGCVLIPEVILLIYIVQLKKQIAPEVYGVTVSVLLPARNEANTISEAIRSLLDQEFGGNNYEILVGDDDSIDNTGDIVRSMIEKDSRLKYFQIRESGKRTGGKAGVLDILMTKAAGQHLLIADADMIYPPSWIKSMSGFISQGKLISSFTRVRGSGNWNHWQNLEWLLNLSGVKWLEQFGFKLTAIGNNMGYLKSDYQKTPGFGAMREFMTEDMELLRQMKSASVNASLVFSDQTLGATRPAENLKSIISQRTRWMSGAFKSPPWLITGWFFRVMLLPCLLGLCFFNVKAGVILCLIHWLSQIIIQLIILVKLKLKVPFFALLTFDFFYIFLNVICLIEYFRKPMITWKGRSYLKQELKHHEV